MRSWLACILVFLVSAPLLAQTAKPETSTTTTTTTTTTKKKATARKHAATKRPTRASEVQSLRDAVSAQQQQIQMLRDEIQKRDSEMQQMQQQINSLQSTTQQAQSTAASAASTSKANEDALSALKTNVTKVETTVTSTATGLQGQEKRVKSLENPTAIHYKGITIKPGGFVALYGIWRRTNTNSSAVSNFSSFALQNQPDTHLPVWRFDARHTNLNLAADAVTHGLKTRAYFEIDFENTGFASNEVATNSYVPRMREAWVQVETKSGLAFLTGQTWSILTPNRKGMGGNTELRPATIDASYLVGFHYARVPSFRITKNFNNKIWAAFSVEQPEWRFSGAAPSAATIAAANGFPTASNTYNAASATLAGTGSTTIDSTPDFGFKVNFEPGFGHYELGGIVRVFRNRITNTAATTVANAGHNNNQLAGGITFNLNFPIVPKKATFVLDSLAGWGVGRYGPGGGPDAVFKPDGSIEPVKGGIFMAGVETHPTATTDFYIFAGAEYFYRTLYAGNIGYGVLNANQTGCFTELGTCAGVNKDVFEITPVLWHSFYKGNAGTLRMGLQYEFIRRTLWHSTGANASPDGTPYGDQHVIMTAVRWFFP
jgi:hypothetical protein